MADDFCDQPENHFNNKSSNLRRKCKKKIINVTELEFENDEKGMEADKEESSNSVHEINSSNADIH